MYGPHGLDPGTVNLAGPSQTVARNNWAELAKVGAVSGAASTIQCAWPCQHCVLSVAARGAVRTGLSHGAQQ